MDNKPKEKTTMLALLQILRKYNFKVINKYNFKRLKNKFLHPFK